MESKLSSEFKPLYFFSHDFDDTKELKHEVMLYTNDLMNEYPEYDISIFDKNKIEGKFVYVFKLKLHEKFLDQALKAVEINDHKERPQKTEEPKISSKSIAEIIEENTTHKISKVNKKYKNNNTSNKKNNYKNTQETKPINNKQPVKRATKKQINYIIILEKNKNVGSTPSKLLKQMTIKEATRYIQQLLDIKS